MQNAKSVVDHYILVGQTPVPVDPCDPYTPAGLAGLLEWARWFEDADRRVMCSQFFDLCVVSTVFLGLDHAWGGGPPLLYETMVFWDDQGAHEMARCATWLEAEAQHRAMCAHVVTPCAVAAYAWRAWCGWWSEAGADWRRAWGGL